MKTLTSAEQFETLRKMFDDVVRVVKLRKLVDKQADDWMLWNTLDPDTPYTPAQVEALQLAVRDLHRLIDA